MINILIELTTMQGVLIVEPTKNFSLPLPRLEMIRISINGLFHQQELGFIIKTMKVYWKCLLNGAKLL